MRVISRKKGNSEQNSNSSLIYYIYFHTNTLKGINPSPPLSYGLNSKVNHLGQLPILDKDNSKLWRSHSLSQEVMAIPA